MRFTFYIRSQARNRPLRDRYGNAAAQTRAFSLTVSLVTMAGVAPAVSNSSLTSMISRTPAQVWRHAATLRNHYLTNPIRYATLSYHGQNLAPAAGEAGQVRPDHPPRPGMLHAIDATTFCMFVCICICSVRLPRAGSGRRAMGSMGFPGRAGAVFPPSEKQGERCSSTTASRLIS